MTNVTASRLGAANAAVANYTQANALSLKVFAGKVPHRI